MQAQYHQWAWTALNSQSFLANHPRPTLVNRSRCYTLGARAIILFIPFRYFSRELGQSAKTITYTPVLDASQTIRARHIGQVVRATAKVTPWESVCFSQALVACLLLRISAIPYIMHFGLAKNPDATDEDQMKAHAWVTAGSVAVTDGRHNLFKFTVVASYIAPLLHESQSLRS